jgi:hypothetical protein
MHADKYVLKRYLANTIPPPNTAKPKRQYPSLKQEESFQAPSQTPSTQNRPPSPQMQQQKQQPQAQAQAQQHKKQQQHQTKKQSSEKDLNEKKVTPPPSQIDQKMSLDPLIKTMQVDVSCMIQWDCGCSIIFYLI